MEREVLIDSGLAAIDGALDGGEAIGDFPDLRRRGAFGGKSGRLDLGAGAQFHDVEDVAQRRLFIEVDAKRAANLLGDESADALPADHQPVSAQGGDRLADDGAADAGGGDHFLLGRQARAGQQFSADDVGGQPRDDFGGQSAWRLDRPERGKIFRQTSMPCT